MRGLEQVSTLMFIKSALVRLILVQDHFGLLEIVIKISIGFSKNSEVLAITLLGLEIVSIQF